MALCHLSPSLPSTKRRPKRIKKAWAKYLGVPVGMSNSIGMKMAMIPAGEFLMGSPENEEGGCGRRPAAPGANHKALLLGRVRGNAGGISSRVTGNNPSWFSRGGAEKDAVAGLDTRRFPVENVSWHDAVEFCRRLSELPGEKAARHVYRLPTEAQWEHACRAGATTRFSFGNECNGRQANCDGRYPCGTLEKGPHLGRTAQVGSYPANVFGLYDMHGNVWQLCEDWYDGGYYAGSPMDNPAGPTSGLHRVVRGWRLVPRCRGLPIREPRPQRAGDCGHYLGFRVSLTLTAKA